jgi:hypothetical protein
MIFFEYLQIVLQLQKFIGYCFKILLLAGPITMIIFSTIAGLFNSAAAGTHASLIF